MTLAVILACEVLIMKVIYQGQLWAVVCDDGDGLWLEDFEESPRRVHAPYSSKELAVDPTDWEVEAAKND